MRAKALILFVAAAACVGVTIGAGGGQRTYRVDAIFDSTANLIPGQDVKIAGARVGQVVDIDLTKERKARVRMEIEQGFAPFRSDADCTIRPQSLIGEKFVQCRPGTPDSPPLPADDGAVTVPLQHTHSPVDLDLVFAALRRPYSQRLAIVLNELGTGLAGRSDDLNDTIRRANPALQEANDVLEILDRDRHALGRLVDQSDRIVGELAGKRREVTSFIERADRVGQTFAGRRGELGESIDRLPPLLAELEPTAERLAELSADATPTLHDLRAAAPGAKALLEDFDPVADAARPALVSLASASKVGRRAVRAARPIARDLQPVAEILRPIVGLGADLNESLRENGVVEHLLLYMFYGAGAQARFDQFSHILPSYQIAGSCQQYATAPAPGCSARFGQDAAASDKPKTARTRRRPGTALRREPPARVQPKPRREAAAGHEDAPATPESPLPDPIAPLVDWLLGP